MKKFILSLGLVLSITACAEFSTFQTQLDKACTTAMTLSSFVPVNPITPYVIAGCATEEGLAKLATDPSSVEWVNGLVSQIKVLFKVS